MKTASVASQNSDVTGLFKISGDLRPVEALLRNTVEHAPVGIAFANRDGTFRHCNRAFCSMLGFAVEELGSRSIATLTHAEDLAVHRPGLERLWRGELPHLDVEKRYLRKDGSALWVRVTTSLVQGGGAEAECSVEFLRDISTRKEMAAALLQNQTLLATVIARTAAGADCLRRQRAGDPLQPRRGQAFWNLCGATPQALPAAPTLSLPRSISPDGTTPVPREEIAHWHVPCAVRRAATSSSSSSGRTAPCARCCRARSAWSGLPASPSAPWRWSKTSPSDASPRRSSSAYTSSCWSRHGRPGMAEVATNVLHNVGNVLNSVNVSASMVSERIRKSKCAGLARVAALLNEHAADLATFLAGAQGRHLPVYLQELAAELIARARCGHRGAAALRSNIEHIKEIVAMQQSYARRGGVTDTVDVRALVEDSLRMNEGAFSRHGVTLVRDFEEVPPIRSTSTRCCRSWST